MIICTLYISCMLLVCGKHLHDHILSFRGQVWLTPSIFIEVPAQGQDRKRPCLCTSGMSILPLFQQFFDQVLELLLQCGIFHCMFSLTYIMTFIPETRRTY